MSENPKVHSFRQRVRKKQRTLNWKFKFKWPDLSFGEWREHLPEMLFFALAGFLLGRAQVLGSLLPFGPAYFAALVCSDRKQVVIQAFPVIAGLLTVVSGQQLFCNIGVIGILAVVFLLYSIDANRQWVAVPALVLTAVIVAKGLTLFLGQASDYLIMSAIFESLFAAGLSLVFLVVIEVIRGRRFLDRLAADEVVCVFIFILGLIMSLGSWSIGNVEIRSMLSRLLVMLAAFLGGGGAGAGIGALVGVIPSLSEMIAPSVIGMYAFSGLLAGAFNGFGRMGVVMGFFLGNLLLALYLVNTALILSSLTASMAAAVLFFILPKEWLLQAGKLFSYNAAWPIKTHKDDSIRRLTLQKLNNMSKVFEELACTLEQLSGDMEPEEDQHINSVLNKISVRVCQDCTLQKMCWEKDFYQTYRSIMALFTTIETNGYASIKDMPATLRKRCSHAREMLAAVNCLYELYQKNYYWQRYMENTRNLVANQMTGSAQIIDKVAKEIKNSGRSRELLEVNLNKALAKKGFFVDKVTVTEMGEKILDLTLELQSCPGVDECGQLLPGVVSRLTGKEYNVFQSNCSFDTGVKTCCFRMLASGALKLKMGKCQMARDEDSICGDSTGSILLSDGKMIIMLSDGMGVGAKAALESSTTLALLEQLLETGFNQQVAINTINSVLMLRSKEESFATLDICIVDLYSGETNFIKIGGGPSFIKNHQDGVKIIRGSSLPIGILHTVEMETIQELIGVGDTIVLASDGLLDTGKNLEDAEKWIAGILESSSERSPDKLAESLVKNAVNFAGGKPRDDISVFIAVVEDYSA
ncbi:stage II sporulation protein E [Candidatus Formimonas warabiya]|uniref:Stage II sporulation protein E n=1 Tax=Formimonas warabiya TaxID=1761012 RepID=A0A3G1KXS9_FORW1|nr:stage II sporulation protein E [Candidatus Formimonas warabiya]ATW27015.1 stage II sporulation protein E [Candidatus Formimonas warabiya]